MNYEKKYKELVSKMERAYLYADTDNTKVVLEEIYPEIKSNKDEKIREALISILTSDFEKDNTINDITIGEIIDRLEKQDRQKPIDKEKVLIGARSDVALSIMHFLDKNTFGMCLSNMECANLEKAVRDSDWSKVYRYMKKKLEKQDSQDLLVKQYLISKGYPVNTGGDIPTYEELFEIIKGAITEIDEVEPKFKVGDWIVNDNTKDVFLIKSINNGYCTLEDIKGNILSPCLPPCESESHLWTINDAKDGDVLTASDNSIFIFKNVWGTSCKHYIALASDNEIQVNTKLDKFWETTRGVKPATKEERETLFEAMDNAGYTFDFQKKYFEKIEQKSTQETEQFKAEHGKYYYCIKDYFCGGKKQASKGDVIQALRGLPIMGLKDASEYFLPVNSIKYNTAWSKEDELIISKIKSVLNAQEYHDGATGIKMNPYNDALDWLNSLRPQKQWKPSEEQIKAIKLARSFVTDDFDEHPTLSEILVELEKQLKKLKE